MEKLFPFTRYGDAVALVDSDAQRSLTYRDLTTYLKRLPALECDRSLVFLFTENRIEEVAAYLTALNAGHVVCLLDARLKEEIKQQLVSLYHPRFIIQGDTLRQEQSFTLQLHPKLTLLLSTSGTTGSPKMIRLSADNVLSNAKAIIEYLAISSSERAVASLPIHYSYGLSVLHTHLLAGATVVWTRHNVLQKDFWMMMRRERCTSFAGVPYTYEMLERLDFKSMQLPDLMTMTQAGGHLKRALALSFWDIMQKKGGRFFVMYGQTEATARISYVPPATLPEKEDSIGISIPRGSLEIVEGELVYKGPNVMLGYAESAEDLNKGDELHGVLHTGDLGWRDDEGFFYVTGRTKRISKVYGYRINLDEVERELSLWMQVVATSDDQYIYLYFENGSQELIDRCIHHLAEKYKLHYTTFVARQVKQWPRTASGKIDYTRL